MDISVNELNVLIKDVKRYLDIMNIPDENERDRKLEEFFDLSNGWRNEKEQEEYEKELQSLRNDYPDSPEEEIIAFANVNNNIGKTRRFLMLNNVFVYSTFRQQVSWDLIFSMSRIFLSCFSLQITKELISKADSAI